MKKLTPKIIEIWVHKSKRNPRLGYAVALLFPCNHNKYLGITLYKGDPESRSYRTQDARIIRFEDYEVMDKEACKLCPHNDEVMWLDSLPHADLEAMADVAEAIDND